MKITTYGVIDAMVRELLPEQCPDLLEKLGEERAVWCVMAIYLMNDVTSGYGQDFTLTGDLLPNGKRPLLSVISSPNKISVIDCYEMSYYTDSYNVCGYENLHDDISNILIWIQTAFDRISSRS